MVGFVGRYLMTQGPFCIHASNDANEVEHSTDPQDNSSSLETRPTSSLFVISPGPPPSAIRHPPSDTIAAGRLPTLPRLRNLRPRPQDRLARGFEPVCLRASIVVLCGAGRCPSLGNLMDRLRCRCMLLRHGLRMAGLGFLPPECFCSAVCRLSVAVG